MGRKRQFPRLTDSVSREDELRVLRGLRQLQVEAKINDYGVSAPTISAYTGVSTAKVSDVLEKYRKAKLLEGTRIGRFMAYKVKEVS